jgi:hypothetical protein
VDTSVFEDKDTLAFELVVEQVFALMVVLGVEALAVLEFVLEVVAWVELEVEVLAVMELELGVERLVFL